MITVVVGGGSVGTYYGVKKSKSNFNLGNLSVQESYLKENEYIESIEEGSTNVESSNNSFDSNCSESLSCISESFISEYSADSIENYDEIPFTKECDFVFVEMGNYISGYTGTDTVVKVPPEIGGVPVNWIWDCTFENNYNIEKIIFPSSVTMIGYRAFNKCISLKEVVFPEVMNDIWYYAFEDCCSLEKVVMPKKLTTFSTGIFYNCSSLREISVPEGVKVLESENFWNCTSLRKINLPSTLEEIQCCFKGVTLDEIEFPSSLKTLSEGAFYYANRISHFEFKPGLVTIGIDAFNYQNTDYIVIPDTVKLWQIDNSINNPGMCDIFYAGNIESFNKIIFKNKIIPEFNETSNIHIYSDDYLKNGWHYVDGKPVIYK